MKNKLKIFLSNLFWVVVLFLLSSGKLLAGEVVPASPIKNPISSNTFEELLTAILNIIIEIGTPIVVIAILFVGFKFVTAQGNPGKLKEAKDAFLWVIVGAAIVISCKVIVIIIQDTVAVISMNDYLSVLLS